MGEWGDTPPTFDRSSDAWGSSQSAFGDEDEGGGDQYVEMIGSQLWVAGTINLGRFRRVSDFVNIVQGYLVMRDVMVLTQTGESTRLTLPELRVMPDDIAVVGQHSDDRSGSTASGDAMIEKRVQRLVVVTRSHMIDGDVFIHGDGSIMSFVDATDPKFIPMTDVRVRWVSDRKLAARYPFALVQRAQILGVATEGIKLGDAATVARRAAALKAQPKLTSTEAAAVDEEVAAIAGTGSEAAADEG
jgi:hypothetical protein